MSGKPVKISIIANGRQARAELAQTAASADLLGKSFSRSAKVIGGALAVGTIVRAGKAFIANGDAYTSQLNKIAALTTAQQRAQVGGINGVAKTLEKGGAAYAAYGNTVGDAAAGVVELVKAGQTLPNALKAVNATLVLAKAGELDVADASGLVATALTTWHLPAKRAGDVANYLANAANISTSDVTDLGEALKFVAPVAAKVGVNAQTTAALLAQLSNAGIKGTLAGTGLRKVLESLQAPTGGAAKVLDQLGVSAFTSSGKVRPFGKVMAELQTKLSTLSDADRKMDLRKIFGLTGITSAQVLLDNVKNIDAYTKGVERAGAAQKLAQANSKGLAGTLRRAGADFKTAGQEAYRAFSPVADNALRPLVDMIEKNQGAITGQAKTIAQGAVPALKSFATAAGDTAQAVGDVAAQAKPLLPLLGTVATVAKSSADAFHAIPAPLKTVAVEAGLLALVMPRLSGGIATATGAMTAQIGTVRTWSGALASAETRSTALGLAGLKLAAASKTAAGVGGMLALAQSSKVADSGLRTLGTTASGALLGFSAGGPVGAAIGGGIGLLGGLWSATHKANDEMRRVQEAKAAAKQALEDLQGTLNTTTGAYTRLTRTMVAQRLQQAGVFDQLGGSGLNRKQIVDAALGQQGAIMKLLPVFDGLNAKIDANKAKMAALRPAYEAAAATDRNRAQAISDQINALDGQNRAMQGTIDTFGAQARAAAGAVLATKAQDLATRGYVGTLKGLPKDLATKIHTTGVDGSLTEVARLARQYKLTPKQIVTLIKAEGIEPTKAAINSVASTMKSVAGRASGYGSSAGSAYGSGFVGGISAWTGRAEFAAMAMAGAAHAAAMRELNAHSPSRKMIQVGKWFSQGFAIGIEKDASKVLNSVDTLFGKLDKKQRPAIKRLTAQYISGKHGLNAIARAQADVNNRLQDAQQKLADAKQAWKDYRDSVKTSIVAFGNITELGKNSAGNATADGIVKQLQARAAAVEKYKALVEQLKKEHLNGTALQQILDAGVDGGLQTAMAIEQGGPAVIAQINNLQSQIAAAGGGLGTSMANNFQSAGVAAAQGMVNGLISQQRQLERASVQLANAMVKAIKKRLGIHSPSKVFQGLGRNSVQGLNIGLDSTYVRKSGEVLASSLVKGFGTPSLSANTMLSPALLAAQQQSTQTMRITFSAEQLDRMRRGLEVTADVALAAGSGARTIR
ncbi:hypothetical protein JCM18899A_32650 [Nocardioides sp. AN3]